MGTAPADCSIEDSPTAFDFDVLDPTKIIPEERLPASAGRAAGARPHARQLLCRDRTGRVHDAELVPGIDFSNDPLLQGRNFSYLDTQLKRLGGPNFTHMPINAPKCPFHHFQQDGHMAMRNPVGRANYEPNSWGRRSAAARESGDGLRDRSPRKPRPESCACGPESFADHYSQARQFYISQTIVEQRHIADALIFELSKCEVPASASACLAICSTSMRTWRRRSPMVSGSTSCRQPATPAVTPRTDLPPSDALSILKRPPGHSQGRKLGVLVTDGADAAVSHGLQEAVDACRGGTWNSSRPRSAACTCQ